MKIGTRIMLKRRSLSVGQEGLTGTVIMPSKDNQVGWNKQHEIYVEYDEAPVGLRLGRRDWWALIEDVEVLHSNKVTVEDPRKYLDYLATLESK